MKHRMKKMKWILSAVCFVGLSLASCDQDPELAILPESGYGQLSLTLGAEANFVQTRAVTENTYKDVNNYTVVVMDKDGNERIKCKGSEITSKMPLTLPIGGYTVEAYYGKEQPASRDFFYVFGKAEGSIKANKTEDVTLTCTPTCGRITVNFNSEMSEYFSNYNVKFFGTEALGDGNFSWEMADKEPWYVKLAEAGEEIGFTITTTTKEEYIHDNKESVSVKTGTFKLMRNKAYKMNVNVRYNPTETGDVSIEITIDESTNDKTVDIEVPVDWV